MKDALEALSSILSTEISYLTSSIYIKKDPWDMINKSQFPFVNLVNVRTSINKAENLAFTDAERHAIEIQIEYAVSSMDISTLYEGTNSKKGIDDVTSDLWTAIKTDQTISSTVDGFDLDADTIMEWSAEPGVLKVGAGYMAGYTMIVRYYKDTFK